MEALKASLANKAKTADEAKAVQAEAKTEKAKSGAAQERLVAPVLVAAQRDWSDPSHTPRSIRPTVTLAGRPHVP
jgi:hypothetical protein